MGIGGGGGEWGEGGPFCVWRGKPNGCGEGSEGVCDWPRLEGLRG